MCTAQLLGSPLDRKQRTTLSRPFCNRLLRCVRSMFTTIFAKNEGNRNLNINLFHITVFSHVGQKKKQHIHEFCTKMLGGRQEMCRSRRHPSGRATWVRSARRMLRPCLQAMNEEYANILWTWIERCHWPYFCQLFLTVCLTVCKKLTLPS